MKFEPYWRKHIEKTGKEELALEQYRKVSQWNQTEELYRSMVRIATKY